MPPRFATYVETGPYFAALKPHVEQPFPVKNLKRHGYRSVGLPWSVKYDDIIHNKSRTHGSLLVA